MSYEQLKSLVEMGLSTRQISKKLNKSQTTIRYWLKKFHLATVIIPKDTKVCPKCKQEKPKTEFYLRKRDGLPSSRCKQCNHSDTLNRQRLFKLNCLTYLGNKCVKCGYNKCPGALEFHHQNPIQKDFTISHIKLTKFNDRVKKELDKCIILCSNCHKEIHWL